MPHVGAQRHHFRSDGGQLDRLRRRGVGVVGLRQLVDVGTQVTNVAQHPPQVELLRQRQRAARGRRLRSARQAGDIGRCCQGGGFLGGDAHIDRQRALPSFAAAPAAGNGRTAAGV